MAEIMKKMSEAKDDDTHSSHKQSNVKPRTDFDRSVSQITEKESKTNDLRNRSLPAQRENESESTEVRNKNSNAAQATQKEIEPEISEVTHNITDGSILAQEKKSATDRKKEKTQYGIINDESKTTDIVQEACKYRLRALSHYALFADCDSNYSYHNKCVAEASKKVCILHNCSNITSPYMVNSEQRQIAVVNSTL